MTVETTHLVLTRTAAGASSRAVAEEVDGVSYSAVQRVQRAAREVSQSRVENNEESKLSLVG